MMASEGKEAHQRIAVKGEVSSCVLISQFGVCLYAFNFPPQPCQMITSIRFY